jgi:putative hydrolase of the HAD superfamily
LAEGKEIYSILGLDDVKGVIFDCYKTLVDISTNENHMRIYEPLSKQLSYYGIKLFPEELIWEYKRLCEEAIEGIWEKHL